ncbi:aldose epimerase [Falsiroseomonas sp. HW251]|uniref:aldose epimerase family protein n=1 Tax=Falsiroseomonas sp. HW251 TaxID=3390998 RepID=UPI003D320FED
MDIRAGDAIATILPDRGAAFTRLDAMGRAILRPMPDGADPNRGFHGSFLMAPWTNRLDAGRIVVAGVEHRMPINRPEENTAIHGFLREMAWTVEAAASDRVVLSCRFDRTPFTGVARMDARIAPDHLALDVALTNEGAVPTPMGFGWHPYFDRPAGTRIAAGARIVFGRDARNLAIAPRPSGGLLGDGDAPDGVDGHYAGWDGSARIDWPDGHGMVMRATGAWARNMHFFTPRDGSAIAVEPVTHAPDAINNPAAAAHGAMHVLSPGESLAGSLMIHWH